MSGPIIEIEIDVDPSTVAVEIDAPTTVVQPPEDPRIIFAATAGPPGPAGIHYTYTQTSPAATWTITHPLGRTPSSVTVWQSDVLVDADVETPDTSTVVITFSSPQSGRAEII
jgi:hypothetical protein